MQRYEYKYCLLTSGNSEIIVVIFYLNKMVKPELIVMKSQFIKMTLLALLGFSCSTQNDSSEDVATGPLSLEGSWEITEKIDHDGGKTEWEPFGTGLIYQKHVTPTHFTWVGYDPANDVVVGAGGGSYTLEGNKYVENIEFFIPVEDGYVGQTITFEAALEGDTWIHKGSTPLVEFDPEVGEVVVFDTTYIEEKWVKIKGSTENENFVKTWHLENYKPDPEATYDSHPDFVGYMKLITPTHFVWIQYNNSDNGGEVIRLGSGTWSFDGTNYIENIDLWHPQGSNQIGTSVTFDYRIEDGKWYHFGYVKQVENGVAVDSSFVDEIWASE